MASFESEIFRSADTPPDKVDPRGFDSTVAT